MLQAHAEADSAGARLEQRPRLDSETALLEDGLVNGRTRRRTRRPPHADHYIFFLYHFHTFLYTPSTLNPKP